MACDLVWCEVVRVVCAVSWRGCVCCEAMCGVRGVYSSEVVRWCVL